MSVTTHMPNGFKRWSHPTFDEMKQACRHIAKFASYNDKFKHIDCIVGIARGGLVPAVLLSHQLNVPMEVINYSSKKGNGDDKNHNNMLPKLRHKKILLTDDLVDTGMTLREVADHYTSQGHEVLTAVIYYKEMEESAHTPDVWAVKVSKNFGWITFPHEDEVVQLDK